MEFFLLNAITSYCFCVCVFCFIFCFIILIILLYFPNLQVAAMNGHVNAMILLQAMGASIQGQTAEGHTALHLAAKK